LGASGLKVAVSWFVTTLATINAKVGADETAVCPHLFEGIEMSYTELIEKKLQTLPEAKQAEVFDFVEFLVARNQLEHHEEHALAKSALADMMKNPLRVLGFTPLSREEANAR
jgi:hypothetical protein